jgi:predicted molibdopterin-dependent oxidoreductase YjgC
MRTLHLFTDDSVPAGTRSCGFQRHLYRSDRVESHELHTHLSNDMLYCTVCDNNHGNCVVHNTTKLMAIEHQRIPFPTKAYEVDNTNPFYRYDPDQASSAAGA